MVKERKFNTIGKLFSIVFLISGIVMVFFMLGAMLEYEAIDASWKVFRPDVFMWSLNISIISFASVIISSIVMIKYGVKDFKLKSQTNLRS